MTIRDLLFLNLILQAFDGLFSLQAFSVGAVEANPVVAAAISTWGVTYGLAYKKVLASILLLLIFTLRRQHSSLVRNALLVTASAYFCIIFICLWQLLR